MIVGLISDTHGFFDPRLSEIFSGCELILHAGDVGPDDVLEELRRIAPVRAVRGNVDPAASNLPLSLTLTAAGLTVHVLHILPVAQSQLEAWATLKRRWQVLPRGASRLLHAFDPSLDVVLFGHSHQPCVVELGDILWVNPGSAGRKRFKLPRTCARLEVSGETAKVHVLPLEPYEGLLPRPVRFEPMRKEL
jgi:putative phosphoesterase